MKTVLAIEDEFYMLKLYEDTLGKGSFQVIARDNWEEGRAVFQDQAVDLVLLDIGLPNREGLEILKEIRERNKEIPVIIASAYGSRDMIVLAKQQGITDFIVKPFRIPVLREKIKKILGLE